MNKFEKEYEFINYDFDGTKYIEIHSIKDDPDVFSIDYDVIIVERDELPDFIEKLWKQWRLNA